MGSAGATKLQPPSKPMKRESSTLALPPPPRPEPLLADDHRNPNPNPSSAPEAVGGSCAAVSMEWTEEDEALRGAHVLSREEVLRRRLRRVRQLERYYRRQYWALMEEVRVRHRDYCWEYGKSPFEEEEDDGGGRRENGVAAAHPGSDGSEEGGGLGRSLGFGLVGVGVAGKKTGERSKCVFAGCKSKAMPLTRFCHSHILSDCNQTLYKPCTYVIKSAPNGPICCQKPVLRAAVPSLCPVHFQKAQKHVSQALKKAGLNVSSSSRPAPKFHVIIAEYVRQIQAKRREALSSTVERIMVKDEKVS